MVMFDLICPYFTVFPHILLRYALLTIDTCHEKKTIYCKQTVNLDVDACA